MLVRTNHADIRHMRAVVSQRRNTMMQKKTLIAMAVLAASCSAMAADNPTIFLDDKNPHQDAVTISPSDANANGFLQNNATNGSVGTVTFGTENNFFKIGYIKNMGQNLTIDRMELSAGATLPTLGTIEFYPGSSNSLENPDTRDKTVHVKQTLLNTNSVLRIIKTSYENQDQYMTGKTSVILDEVTLSDKSAIALGVGTRKQDSKQNLDSADETSIGKLIVSDGANYAGIVAGTTSSGGSVDEADNRITIGEIDLHGNKLDLAGSTKLTGATYSGGYQGVTLLGMNGTTTVNMLSANSKLVLGDVGVAPTEVGTASLLADAADAGTATKLVLNFSEAALTSEGSSVTFGKDAVIAKGSTMEATTEGAVTEKTVEETAQLLAKKAYGDESVQNAVKASEGPAKVTVAAKGIEDGFTGEVDLTNLPAGDEDFTFENVARTENETTHSIAQLSAVGYMQWRSAMNHLQYRMGELRDHSGYNNGGWIRFYGGEDKYGSQDVKNQYYGFQSGYDHRIEGTNVIVGGAVSYTKGDSDFTFGEGDNYNYDFTAYGTWLADSGLFVDGTIKYGRLSNDLTVDDRSAFGASSADYDTNAMSVSLETGWRFPVMQNAYVEPQAEIMYGHVWAADYSFGQYDVTNEALDTTVGRLGVQAGLQCPSKKGSAYVRASVLHDFQGDADTTFRDGLKSETITQELGDTWYELGLGAQWNVTDATYLYADVQYADGGEVESPWRASVGMRFAW